MRGTKSLLAIFVMAGLLAGCQSKENEPIRSSSSSGGTSMAPSGQRADQSNMALVRFINADPNMKTVSAYMDSDQAFGDVSFKTVTPYREVPDGSHTFHLSDNASMQAGRYQGSGRKENEIISESKSLSSGKYYTVVLLPSENHGNTSNPMSQLKIINDDFGTPSRDKAQIRVIDAVADAGKVDVIVRPKNDILFSDVDVNSNPSYKDVDPGTVTLEVRQNGKTNVLFTLPNTTVDAGHLYTVVLASKGTIGRNFDAVIVEDQYAQHRDSIQGGTDNRDNDRYEKRDNSGIR